jgi:thiamine biosynthesis lipoprotein
MMRIVLLGVLTAFLASCATEPRGQLQRFEFTSVEMGMDFRIVLYASDSLQAEQAASAGFDRIRALNTIFSDYEDDSELTQLSRSSGSGRAVALSPELWDVLSQAQALAAQTQGAFDVTVGPYTSLWRRARRRLEFPRSDLLDLARQRVGYAKLHLDPARRTATLAVPRMRLDLGGIAKGYAMDEALQTLTDLGIRSALVSGGGDLVVSDPPPGRRAWRIGLAPLNEPNGAPTEFLQVSRKAVATSGDLFQFVEIDGRRYSHIVDPRTGIGLTNRSLVTVVAGRSAVADSLATAIAVMDAKPGLELVEQRPGVEARIAIQSGASPRVRVSRGFTQLLE